MLKYSSLSRNGNRDINEDSVGSMVCGNQTLLIVADGLGGHGFGDLASGYTVEQFMSSFPYCSEMEPEEYLRQIILTIHEGLLKQQKEKFCQNGMKSTVAAVVLSERKITIGHVGDSRVYLFGKHGVLWRTMDHSVPQMLAVAGEIKEKEIRHHPDRNKLLHALGAECDELKIDIKSYDHPDDVCAILLCSDGFWEYIEDKQMKSTLFWSKTPEDWLNRMEKIVLKQGKGKNMDNYSAVAAIRK